MITDEYLAVFEPRDAEWHRVEPKDGVRGLALCCKRPADRWHLADATRHRQPCPLCHRMSMLIEERTKMLEEAS